MTMQTADDSGVEEDEDLTPEESLSEQDRPWVVTQEEQEEEEEGLDEVDWRANENNFGLDSEKVAADQLRSPWMSGALAIDSQFRVLTLRMAPQFEMRNGVLMRRVHLCARAGPANTKLVPVIRLKFIEAVLYYCHGDLMSAHLGKTKTLEKVRHHGYCGLVGKRMSLSTGKGSRPWRAGRMQRMPVKDLSGPFSLVVVDAIGPLPTTDSGNKYILVFVGYFTRWAEAFAIQALDSITFVNVMIDGVICRHGVPGQLLSDRGTNFTSKLARSLYQTLGIKKLFVPRTTHRHRDTPFFSLYGRDLKLTLDLAFLNTTKNWKSNKVANYRRQLYKFKTGMHYAYKIRKQYPTKKVTLAKRGERKTKKVAFSWHGPYRVLGQVGENAYRIAIPHHPDKVVTVNVNRLNSSKGVGADLPVTTENNEGEGRGVSGAPRVEDGDQLSEEDLPAYSYVERVAIGSDETTFTGVSSLTLYIVAKRVDNSLIEYLTLTPTYETFWLSRNVLSPEYDALITARKKNLPELRRSEQLVDANAVVDEDELLF
ncbi:LOW QUALITY PROTEIN: hypothetical protein PHMEG_0008869 [Phytophthora megakarya]|uniref:Integrase catalytic domain-containing protein n=1 Tax=Phytophthora megakarya TaxID=4795 RepID=A0A225WIY5_9STRA|nr:LOW QUALITY PROTEIN: hypothetical protein PHMEG_0008869 [Phytophthora megakarya]